MNSIFGRVARYRFRASLRRRKTDYLAVLVLVAVLGGIAMAAVAGARRTQSFFPAFLAHSKPSSIQVQPFSQSLNTTGLPQAQQLERRLAALPHVAHVTVYLNMLLLPLRPDGTPARDTAFVTGGGQVLGSPDGEFFDQDRPVVSEGRMADPSRADEFVADPETAREFGWRVGHTVSFGVYTVAEAQNGLPNGRPEHTVSATLTGLVLFNNHAVVHDDVDRFVSYALVTPTLTRTLMAHQQFFPYYDYGLRFDRPGRDVSALQRSVIATLPPGTAYNFYVPAVATGEVERAVKPESIALGAFGAIAGIAALLIVGLTIGRQLRANPEDLQALRALGGTRRTTAGDGLIGVLAALVIGAVAAAGVALALSPLAPIGAVREVDPFPHVTTDWTVLVVGVVVLVVALVTLTFVLAERRRPDRAARLQRRASTTISAAAAASGVPAPAAIGLGFAIDPGRGPTAVPVRSALFGTFVAVALVVATLTFGSGLHTLISHPALYGWNWSYGLEEIQGGNVPGPTTDALAHDPYVAAWDGLDYGEAQIDGRVVPILVQDLPARVGPPLLSGHAVEAKNQIVLGPATLALLQKRVGDTVSISYGTPADAPVYIAPTAVRIVGTATLPAIGDSASLHTAMGAGAIVARSIEPPAFQAALTDPDPLLNGPAIAIVRVRRGVNLAAARASIQRDADAGTKAFRADGDSGRIAIVPIERPAEIVNYRTMGATPAILVSGLAAATVFGLGLTLAASVRRRRRDLALLKALGFTRRQLATTVASQATIIAVIGVTVGVPVGIAIGRWLWILFAHAIYAVPNATVPTAQIVLIALSTVVLANAVGALPGRAAARAKTALLLRSE